MTKIKTFARTALIAATFTVFAAPATAEPAIWVAKTGKATAYLFGTFHLLKTDAVWFTPKVEKAFDTSSELWLEITDGDDAAAMKSVVMQYGVDAAHPLSTKLSTEDKALLEKDAATLGAPPSAFEPMRPWLVALQLTVAPMVKAGFDPAGGADHVLKDKAAARHKPLKAFETATGQMKFFADLPLPIELAFLHTTLRDFDDMLPKMNDAAQLWVDGKPDEIDTKLTSKMRVESPELYKVLLKDRNDDIARKLLDRMKAGGTIFVAVGAAHLAGPDSIQKALERVGVKARRL
ncbi:TraB/GumN family protein [Sphingomonas oligophenolica]|uniref:TraB/GumN family protein n=1 Tax=Sphingomonas oligophenolica TaxID=301154 RepID=A0A502BXW0_9SPHN|nr:TraB/GumN family protein [Sphingomonas oligophenolica]TPG04336.1 TraB/GumN family protein [Sphingomonas oligophenolica]